MVALKCLMIEQTFVGLLIILSPQSGGCKFGYSFCCGL